MQSTTSVLKPSTLNPLLATILHVNLTQLYRHDTHPQELCQNLPSTKLVTKDRGWTTAGGICYLPRCVTWAQAGYSSKFCSVLE